MFMLEALKALHGDCLLLHWGDKGKAKKNLALIDGGPRTVYDSFLKCRLQQIAEQSGEALPVLDLTMVSHIDEDHIQGILDLAEAIEAQEAPYDIKSLWHNSLEGLLDEVFRDDPGKTTAAVGTAFPRMADCWAGKVLASVPQGQRLHAFMTRRGRIDRLNEDFEPVGQTDRRLVLAQARQKPVKINGLSLTVVAPMAAEIEKLRKAWIRHRDERITAGFSDPSPYNLSSIVVLATFGKKTMLLTGDARGDLIIEGLKNKGLFKKDRFHVDLLKLPHHGSNNNVTPQFFEQITADIYVVSGDDKKFPNPNREAMAWLAEARGDASYKVYCTYDLKYMRKIFGKKLHVPEDGEPLVRIVLS